MRPSKLTSLLIICLFPAFAFCQSNLTADQKEVYRTIVLIANSWSQNNLDTLEKYLDPSYVHTDVRGQFQPRAEWLGYVKERKQKGVVYGEVGFEDVHIEINGNYAFVTGANTFSGAASTGKDNTNKIRSLRFTQILVKDGKIWRRKLFQATYIDAI